MLAFAANSVLTRAAMLDGGMDPMGFAFVRVLAGAVTLCTLVFFKSMRIRRLTRNDGFSVVYLAMYLIGFSIAYKALDTGTGALILFGAVQISMFFWAFVSKEQITFWRIIGACVAFAGLVVLVAPGSAAVDWAGVAWMVLGAVGWAGYSLMGRKSAAPIYNSAVNFALATPLLGLALILSNNGLQISGYGLSLALFSGVVSSGLGYIVWYSVLPHITASTAAVAQLSVPILAFALGVIWLDDPATLRFAVASVIVIGGIALSLLPVTKRG